MVIAIIKYILGSGKRALFEVISRRAQGPTRGQILLNGVPMSMRLFQVRTHELFMTLGIISILFHSFYLFEYFMK